LKPRFQTFFIHPGFLASLHHPWSFDWQFSVPSARNPPLFIREKRRRTPPSLEAFWGFRQLSKLLFVGADDFLIVDICKAPVLKIVLGDGPLEVSGVVCRLSVKLPASIETSQHPISYDRQLLALYSLLP
jgi:hypothetical protein